MNFTTSLPKKNPLVSYIVASAMRCLPRGEERKLLKHRIPDYRMHAVVLHRRSGRPPLTAAQARENFVLCHIRKVVLDGDSPLDGGVPSSPNFKSQMPSKTLRDVSFSQRPVLVSCKSLPLPAHSEDSEEDLLSPSEGRHSLCSLENHVTPSPTHKLWDLRSQHTEEEQEPCLSTEESPEQTANKLTLLKTRRSTVEVPPFAPAVKKARTPAPATTPAPAPPTRLNKRAQPWCRFHNDPVVKPRRKFQTAWKQATIYDAYQLSVLDRYPCSRAFKVVNPCVLAMQPEPKSDIEEAKLMAEAKAQTKTQQHISPGCSRYASDAKTAAPETNEKEDDFDGVSRHLEFV